MISNWFFSKSFFLKTSSLSSIYHCPNNMCKSVVQNDFDMQFRLRSNNLLTLLKMGIRTFLPSKKKNFWDVQLKKSLCAIQKFVPTVRLRGLIVRLTI